MDDQVALGVARNAIARFYDDCCVHLLNDGRAVKRSVDWQALAGVNGRFNPVCIEEDRATAG